MSDESKIQQDYETYNEAVERKAKKELQKIQEQIEKAKAQAKQTGEKLAAEFADK